ncbi:RDD family protein [Cellulomonas sp. KRMCY2]|uniref:RDD family protein n=1 Tax=Cellulomonas sp. KRMCY2 TaxID=1304865 RepID=UPI00045E7E84|nr:RDD family protein [Cellulomonas sp. KRMCY2]
MTIDGGGSTADDRLDRAPVVRVPVDRAPVVLAGQDLLPPARHEAAWLLRVVAALLDQALLIGVTYLAFVVQPVAAPTSLPLLVPTAVAPTAGPGAATWTQSGWVVATVAAVILMQAYLGSSPGKLVVGIAVVREVDRRPVGLLRTLGRLLAHVVDGIFYLGYLRPLWHPRRQTVADSLARTVVLATRRPLTYTLRTRTAGGVLPVWEAPVVPGWRRVATVLAAGSCLIGVLFAAGSSIAVDDVSITASCATSAQATGGDFTLQAGGLEVNPGTATESRLGVERQYRIGEPGVRVTWDWSGTLPTQDVGLHASFVRRDGTGAVLIDHVMRDGQVQPGRGTPLTGGPTGVLLPLDTLAGLGDDWTWSLTTTVGGTTSSVCMPDR